ncbi:phosphotransferase [Virgibacillus sp. L01]|uniref:phosphotransferase n=1 Tax=Virgibacillus sp. L01 TaxID=3457429 RepID=UPI003FD161F6
MKLENNLKYVKVKGLFICLDKNYVILAWLLLFKTRPFNLHLPAHNKYLRIFPGKFIKVLRVFNIIQRLLVFKNKKYESNDDDIISVPYNGHILIKKSGGYKVFNLKEGIVATQYNLDVEEDDFCSITKNLKYISQLSFVPLIKAVDYQNKCVYEEYINLRKAKGFYPISAYFYDRILPVWERNITALPNKNKSLEEYISNQKAIILGNISYLTKGSSNDELIYIETFVKMLLKKISFNYNEKNIQLTLSHGDLHAWNILLDGKDSKLIDWDTLKERTVLHDLFYMLFYNLFGMETKNYNEFLKQLDKVLSRSCLKLDINENGLTKPNQDLYRMLFYLEYITLYIEKKINTYPNRKLIQDGIKKLNNDILVFKEVEEYIFHYQ